MPTKRSSRRTPNLDHRSIADLGPYRKLAQGDEAQVKLPERASMIRMRFMWVDRNGDLTFVDKRGHHRTVSADKVGTIHRSRRR